MGKLTHRPRKGQTVHPPAVDLHKSALHSWQMPISFKTPWNMTVTGTTLCPNHLFSLCQSCPVHGADSVENTFAQHNCVTLWQVNSGRCKMCEKTAKRVTKYGA